MLPKSIAEIDLGIIIPVSNMAGKLEKLKNTLSQGITHGIRFTVVHDFQDFQTGQELKSLINEFAPENILFIEGEFGSPGAARNKGLEVNSHQWVAFWDSDDLPHVNNFLAMVSKAEAEESVVAIGSFINVSDFDSSTLSTQVLDTYKPRALRQIASRPGIWRFAFRNELLKGRKFPNLRMAEDQVFLGSLELGVAKTYIEKDFVYSYFSGASHHLTSKKYVMDDLLIAALLTKMQLRDKNGLDYGFLLELLTRQLISAILHGDYKVKTRAFSEFLKSYLGSNFLQFKSISVILFRWVFA